MNVLNLLEMEQDGETQPTENGLTNAEVRLTYEEYKNMANLLVMHIREKEQRQEDGEGEKRGDIVNWYLKEIENDIETEQELATKKYLVDKVLDRLINHDHVILALQQQDDDKEKDSEKNPVLVVHPNYVLE